MLVDELFNELRKKEVAINTMFDNWHFVVIPNEHFFVFREHFGKEVKIGSMSNFRSKHLIRHIHAVQGDTTTEIHIDHGNMYKNPILGIIHLFINVIPYFAWHLIHKKKPYRF